MREPGPLRGGVTTSSPACNFRVFRSFLPPVSPYLRPTAQFSAGFGVGALATSVLISILITFLVIVLVLYLIGRLPLDGRAKRITQIVVIIIGIIALLKYIAVF